MSSEDEDMEFEAPDKVATQGIPPASKFIYDRVYDDFQKWNKVKGTIPVTEKVLVNYFEELAEKNKPPTLWWNYSMLKATLRTNDNIDIIAYSSLHTFLKTKSAGYKPVKAKVFTEEQIEKFIIEAPDEQWLLLKVVCIFGVHRIFSSSKLVNVTIDQMKVYDDLIFVTTAKTETNSKRTSRGSFTITGTFFNIVQKYLALRPANISTNRLFLNYNEDRCTSQPIGRNSFNSMPRRIAKYLKLPNPERYSGISFCITSTNMSNTIPSNVWDNSVTDQQSQYSLDCETGLLKTPVATYKSPSVSAASKNSNENRNGNADGISLTKRIDTRSGTRSGTRNGWNNGMSDGTGNNLCAEHVCTLSCGQMKCASEENEMDALHAFTVMKPPDYNITDVTPALFTSDPFCRWIVAYTHITEPVSPFNAIETFKAITRSTPNNVIVVQKYIRSNSSQLQAAYIVVYGVNCTCQNQSPDIFSFSIEEIKYEL